MKSAKQILKKELVVFEDYFQNAVKSKVPLLNTIMRYITNRKGKQLRPIFVLLSAKLAGDPNEKTYRCASLVEILHTATLVHDDVIDEAETRRGFFSVYALWKTKIAVLVGDYLLSKGLLLSLENQDFDTLTNLSKAVKEMSEGELLQLEKSRKLNITEEEYYQVINGKTASLLSSACASGIQSVTDDTLLITKMSTIGQNVGMAFQIKDDLFDYTTSNSGKPKGNDLQEKKLTLPLIHAFSRADKSEARRIKKIIASDKLRKKNVQEIYDFVLKYDGVGYATQKMEEYTEEAKSILCTFPESESRDAFTDLINFVTERKK